ncbi:CheR family methyltransferase [Virgibacillus halodenitrificans]|jgi:chemotaxis protein methyltransferase CheR|uniref:CheR family methyltransferase n=1 Tax=Virgibacillus halodenitrificans TaxID=1482 RepID=UPI00196A0B39|nr:protein-glutamate O-methyltransferase CheR [Virgibacillus halodenitrificans]
MISDYDDFIAEIKKRIGIDLSLYKEAQMKRRIISLRNKRGFANFHTYYEELINQKELMNEFVDRLTINVSEFYRNPKRWQVLKDNIIPGLLQQKNSIKVWSAACSTGEEPYSVSIMLKEHFPEAKAEIIATDIDENVLLKAKEGIYGKNALKELPAEILKKYFIEREGLYSVSPMIKRNISFKKHNLLADSYPKDVDLLICRNVLIYFTDQAKEEIYMNFGRSLNSNGVLFVGSTEQIFSPKDYKLQLLDTFFYKKEGNVIQV